MQRSLVLGVGDGSGFVLLGLADFGGAELDLKVHERGHYFFGEVLEVSQKLEGGVFGVSFELFEPVEAFEDHVHVHEPYSHLDVQFQRVEGGPQILAHQGRACLVLAVLLYFLLSALLHLCLHLLPDPNGSIEVFFLVAEIDQHLVGVRVHRKAQFLVERQDEALDLILL